MNRPFILFSFLSFLTFCALGCSNDDVNLVDDNKTKSEPTLVSDYAKKFIDIPWIETEVNRIKGDGTYESYNMLSADGGGQQGMLFTHDGILHIYFYGVMYPSYENRLSRNRATSFTFDEEDKTILTEDNVVYKVIALNEDLMELKMIKDEKDYSRIVLCKMNEEERVEAGF